MKIQDNPKISDLFRFLIYFMKPQGTLFLLLIFFLCAWSFEQNFVPYFIKLVIDGVTLLEQNHFSFQGFSIFYDLRYILFLGLAFLLISEAIYRASDFLYAYLIPPFTARIRTYLTAHVTLQSYRYFSNHFPGSLSNKINDLPRSAGEIFEIFARSFLPGILNGIIAISLLFYVYPILGIIMMVWFILHIGISWIASQKSAVYAEHQSEALSTLSGKIVDIIGNILTVRLFTRLPYEKKYLSRYQKDAIQKHIKTLTFSAKVMTTIGLLSLIEYILMILASLYGWSHGWLSVGDLAFVLTLLQNITQATWWTTLEFPRLFQEVGTSFQSYRLLIQKHEIIDKRGAPLLRITHGEIIFEHVTYGHSEENNRIPLFNDLNLTIKGGEKVGLVGFSGSGKTTFVNLILRHFNISKGRILIDGQDITNVTQDSLREAIAVIPQDTNLFHRTLYENIQYGNIKASRKDVEEAAKAAHAHEFIQDTSDGYETLVGERGLKLSGGQRQRIAIARAILKDAPILILDEATSALDTATERKIQESLLEAMQNRTTIVIAHRLSTLSHMDRILVFHKGQVVEEGTHQSLLALEGHYARMWTLQAEGFLPKTLHQKT